MAINLDNVYEFVRDELSPNYNAQADDLFIQGFLAKMLSSSDNSCHRLLTCIGIDIKTYKKKFPTDTESNSIKTLFRKIILDINHLPTPKTIPNIVDFPNIEFAISLSRLTNIDCKPEIKTTSTEKYVRITPFLNYIKFTVKNNVTINPKIPSNIHEAYVDSYYREFESGLQFTELNVTNLDSRNGWIFATNQNDLTGQISKRQIEYLIDCIGFYIENVIPGEKYVYFEYPSNFDEDMCQPTTLIGDWGGINIAGHTLRGNEFFMSYKMDDDWGRTFSVSGKLPPQKERAHSRFDYKGSKSYNFKIGDLKDLKVNISRASDATILFEALKRFEEA